MGFFILVINPEISHFLSNYFECDYHIGEYDLTHLLSLVEMEALGVNYPHLLQDR